jgi:hypothetical protein
VLEVLAWFPRSQKHCLRAAIVPACMLASRRYLAQGSYSVVTDYQEHEALVSSALQRLVATFEALPQDAESGDDVACAAAAQAADCALASYSTPHAMCQSCTSTHKSGPPLHAMWTPHSVSCLSAVAPSAACASLLQVFTCVMLVSVRRCVWQLN